MTELNQNLEALIDKFSKEDTNLCLENRFPYLYTKAYYFIKDGAEAYAIADAFKLPDSSFNGEDLELLKLGCNQLLGGRGFSSKNPFKNLGIRGCHKLFELFHFKHRPMDDVPAPAPAPAPAPLSRRNDGDLCRACARSHTYTIFKVCRCRVVRYRYPSIEQNRKGCNK